MKKRRIQFLYERYARQVATDEELAELKSLLSDPDHEQQIIDWLDETWKDMDHVSPADVSEGQRRAILGRIIRGNTRNRGLRGVAVWSAAAVLVLSLVFLYQYWMPISKPLETVRLTQSDISDIDPGTDKAILTLADGRQVLLDGQEERAILSDPSLQISKTTDGILVYSSLGSTDLQRGHELAYHTLSTPAGGQYQVVLPDGTKVTLNAMSRLKYPQQFPQDERAVEFEGEGYFEVTADPTRPFVVRTTVSDTQQEVRVLGTEFNINSYDHEGTVVTTVVGGRVEVGGGHAGQVLLGSGQQSVFRKTHETIPALHRQEADLNEILAWKDGLFLFNNEPLPDLLRRVSRWYDMTFVYEDDLSDIVFQGNYFRNKGLLNLLKNLEATERVQFRIDQSYIDERRIYVMRK